MKRSLISMALAWIVACSAEDMPQNMEAPVQGETTCESGVYWSLGTTGSPLMNPGLACRSCHQQQAPEMAYYFSGTVFPSLHESNLCNSNPPHGARVEILDADGNVTLTLIPNAVGNFLSTSVVAGVPLPYRARLVVHESVRIMTTPQTNGDCNSCHTEQGTQGAPGRIVWPDHLE